MEMLRDLWELPIYGGLQVRHLIEVAIAFLVLRALYRYLFGRSKASNVATRDAACSCGWRGQTSAHRPKCPRCGKAAIPV